MIKHNNNNSNNKTVLRERKPPPTPNFQPTVNGDSNPHFRINPNPTAVSVDGRLLHALARQRQETLGYPVTTWFSMSLVWRALHGELDDLRRCLCSIRTTVEFGRTGRACPTPSVLTWIESPHSSSSANQRLTQAHIFQRISYFVF